MEYDLKDDALRIQCEIILNNARFVIKKCEEAKATNKQWFIDFEDELNRLSVKRHD